MATEPQDSNADQIFRRRALSEAARYGSDPWVFVRELLQNARDADAREVIITTSLDGSSATSRSRITCRDDGCGMTYEHARRYLFALYASSKDADHAQAGKFGIGFWSVLRLAPTSITVRSRAATGEAWAVRMDGSLEGSRAVDPDPAGFVDTGTEVVLELSAESAGNLGAEAFRAARRYGRFLTRRDDLEQPLRVTVDGRSANAEFSLPTPCSVFRGQGFRGAVGLGEEPRVELFAQGLFVRSASSLRDLEEDAEASKSAATEDALAGMPSLAPRILIDSAELDLLLARSDVRYDKHMRRVLGRTEKELTRLIQKQLQAIRPQPWYRPLLGALRDRIEPFLSRRFAAAGAVGAMLGLTALWWLPIDRIDFGREAGRPQPTTSAREHKPVQGSEPPSSDAGRRLQSATQPYPSTASNTDSPEVQSGDRPRFFPYSDLARSYRGPHLGGLRADRSRAAILYEPATATPFFNALVVELRGARWATSKVSEALPRYREAPCQRDCLRVSLLIAAGPTPLRIPVATGHRLEASSVRLDGESLPVYETDEGEAVLLASDRRAGHLEYRSGPAPGVASAPPQQAQTARTAHASPASELADIAVAMRPLPIETRVRRALDYVARRVSYDRSPTTVRAYARAVHDHSSFVEAALAVGAGDCDVQNGVLLELLRLSEVEARLALGYVGIGGTVAAGLHAWVEYRDAGGRWSVADASSSADPEINRSSGAASQPLAANRPAGVLLPGRVAAGLEPSPDTPAQVAAVAFLLVLLGSAAWMVRRRLTGAIELGADENLAALLGGALQHPQAFAGLPAMFHGRFVPLAGRADAISLHRARRLGAKNRLFRTSRGSALARRAAARGIPVIDAATPEGRVLSLALGAIDLDRWSKLLRHAVDTRLCQSINARLDGLNAPWRLRESTGLPEPWVEIALEDLRLGQRLILLDTSHLEFAPARHLLPQQPDAAAFTVLDVLLHRIDMADAQRARILAAFAETAVAGRAGLGSCR